VSEIERRLDELERLGLGRRLRLVSGPQGPTVLLDGRPVLLLCSNNYLGLADHPAVREAAADAAMRWGVGAGASRLVSGTMTIHRRLEERLAEFKRTESALLFGSGYLANLGVISALAGEDDSVFSDQLNHASIVDGCRLARAQVHVYRHRDTEHLAWCLQRQARGTPLIVTDSVFSMDGDVAPLEELAELAARWGGRLVVDEAHATGNLGPGGRGAVAEAGLEDDVDVTVGTLGKALGSYGAYVCASEELVRYMINASRTLIFSTAPPPPAVAGALAALELLRRRPHLVARLRGNGRALRRALAAEGFPVDESDMPIVPLILGDAGEAVQMCNEAIERGVFAQAIRPPTVPDGTSRLRLAAMASHTQSELELAAAALGDAARDVGVDPESLQRPASERVPLPEPEPVYAVDDDFGDWSEPGTAELGRPAPGRVFDGERPYEASDAPSGGRSGGASPGGALREGAPPDAAPPDAAPSDAPFDIERELQTARAA
jgi:glycine C-acetyltransferase/8-amino-7-oxononanoate synthase